MEYKYIKFCGQKTSYGRHNTIR